MNLSAGRVICSAVALMLAATPQAHTQATCTDGHAGPYPCNNIDLLSFTSSIALGATTETPWVNDIWGWTDPVTGKEYALVGRRNGTTFVDVTTPEAPIVIGDLPLHEGARPTIWRDIKVYADHAFIVADAAGAHGMQVFDLTQLRSVTAVPTTFTETAHYDQVGSAHNIAINEETGFGYIVGASFSRVSCDGGLHMVDLRVPTRPTLAGCFADENTRNGYTHDAQCVVYRGPDTDHQGKEICIGANVNAISIADVTDKQNPVSIAVGTYPEVNYVHQGWLTEDHRYFLQNDESDERLRKVNTRTIIWDLQDLDAPEVLTTYEGPTTSIDHNLYIEGSFVYQANYTSGLRILDISDIMNPREVAYFDTYPENDEPYFQGAWSTYPFFESGNVLISSINEGLFVVRPSSIFDTHIARFEALTHEHDVALRWQTTRERNNLGFDIEQRREGQEDFHKVGFIAGQGPSSTPQDYTFYLDDLAPGAYAFRLRQITTTGASFLSPEAEVLVVPQTHVLSGVYPNPFRGQARFSLLVKTTQHVHLALYDTQGRRVADLNEGILTEGNVHRFDLEGGALGAGLYLIRATGRTFTDTMPVVVLP